MIELIQTFLLVILVDRQFIIRKRYKMGIEMNRPDQYRRGYFAIWIYSKLDQGDHFTRHGGRRLMFFNYGKKKKK